MEWIGGGGGGGVTHPLLSNFYDLLVYIISTMHACMYACMYVCTALTIWEKIPLQDTADMNEIGIGKTQTLVGNFPTLHCAFQEYMYIYTYLNSLLCVNILIAKIIMRSFIILKFIYISTSYCCHHQNTVNIYSYHTIL